MEKELDGEGTSVLGNVIWTVGESHKVYMGQVVYSPLGPVQVRKTVSEGEAESPSLCTEQLQSIISMHMGIERNLQFTCDFFFTEGEDPGPSFSAVNWSYTLFYSALGNA